MARPRSPLPLGYRALIAGLTVVVIVLAVAVALLGVKVLSREARTPSNGGLDDSTGQVAHARTATGIVDAGTVRIARTLPPPILPEDLDAVERRTIDVFRASAPRVVHIENLAVRADPFRRNVLAMPRGTGSGFVWDASGHIVTNFHVIQGADAVRVTLSDGSAWSAALVGFVTDKDLAVLKIDTPTGLLDPVELGSSADLVVGQHVLAIGNPFGLDHTLSTGVISGLGREIMSVGNRPIQGVIQTDAAINPGNSGGPLLDSRGRLIGVNTAIFSPTGASAGIGFAVPVDTVKSIVTQLIEHGRVVRPGLGVVIDEGDLARRAGIHGALVLVVQPGSPAARAGVVPTRRDARSGAIVLGDVIVEMDGERIDDHVDLYRALDRKQIGDTVRLGVLRGQGRIEVRMTLQGVTD
jgi:S1-C subfamily serine protease